MYFQKLESLKTKDKYAKCTMLIESIDEWLALIPKSYTDRLIPELFSVNQEIPIDVSTDLFEELVKLSILKESYVTKCECGQVLKISDSLDNALNYIIYHNENEIECSFCDSSERISTNNVYSIYKLIEKSNKSNFIRKKQEGVSPVNKETYSITLSDRMINNPNRYSNEICNDNYKDAIPPNVRSKLKLLLQ